MDASLFYKNQGSTLCSSPHPVWQVADSLICHKLENTTVSHSVRVLVGQLEKHRVSDVEPACRGMRSSKLMIWISTQHFKKDKVLNSHLLRWSRAEGGMITAKERVN